MLFLTFSLVWTVSHTQAHDFGAILYLLIRNNLRFLFYIVVCILHSILHHDTSLTMSYFSRSGPVDPRHSIPLLTFVSKSASTVISGPPYASPKTVLA